MAERRVSGAAGMMSGRNPSAPVPPSGYERVNGILKKTEGYKGAPPVTRGSYANTTPTGFKSPYIPTGKTKITNTGGASAMMSGNDPTAPIYTPAVQSTPSPFLKIDSATTKAEPTQNPERPGQPSGGVETPALVGKNYSVGGVEYDYSTGQAINPDTGKTSSGGYSIDPKTSARTDYSRGETRTNANGMTQTGTSTSPPPMTMDDASKLLSGGYKVENPYSSNQLPYTQSSPYAGKSNSQIYNQDTLHQHNNDVDYVKLSKDVYGDQSGVELATRNGGMKADYKQMDVNPGQKAPEERINWANRTMADNSDEKVRRRSAMLDGNVGIMQAMRNQEAIQGRVYAGGKHYQVNKNKGQEDQNDFVEISASQARDRSWGNKSADEVFANHLGKAKEKASGADLQTASQNAPAMLPNAVPGQTPMDKSPFDTQDLMNNGPKKSIIGNNSPYTSAKPAGLF